MEMEFGKLTDGALRSFTLPQLLLGLLSPQGSPATILLSNGIIFEIQNLKAPVILLPPRLYTQFYDLKQNANDITKFSNCNIRKSTGFILTENPTQKHAKSSDVDTTEKDVPEVPEPIQLFTDIFNDSSKELSSHDLPSRYSPTRQWPIKSFTLPVSKEDLSSLLFPSRSNSQPASTEPCVSSTASETSQENDNSSQIDKHSPTQTAKRILVVGEGDNDFGILQKLSERILSDSSGVQLPPTVNTPVVKKSRKKPRKPPVKVVREEPEKEKTNLTCQICNQSFSRILALEMHLKIHSNVKDFVCSVCGKDFRWKKTYEAHMYVHQKGNPFKCPYEGCENSYAYKNGLEMHLTSKHNSGNSKVFKCKHLGCDKIFTSLISLKSHVEDIHAESQKEAFVCDVCGKAMTRKSSLKVHMKIHSKSSEKTMLNCDKCDKRFPSAHTLRRHQLEIHLGKREKKFQCTTCGKCYYTKSILKTHEVMHTDARPYRCSECPRTFRSYTHLKGHKNMHLGIKPNKCAFCPKTFTFQSNMLKHVKLHNNNRPFKCDYCDRGFLERQELKKHIVVNHQNPKTDKLERVCEYPDDPQATEITAYSRDDSLYAYHVL